MEMARSILKHMHMTNYLWGEAVRRATYLINQIATRSLQDQTLYEVLKGRKPNLNHLRVFGCLGYAKIEKAQLRKLDDRSRMLVHLGTKPGSKAYRLFDPETRRIVVSRDVVFDETKGWNWKGLDTERKSYDDFVVELGEFGNHGISEQVNTSNQPRVLEQAGDNHENGEAGKADKKIITIEDDESEEAGKNVVGGESRVLRRSERQTSRPKYLDDYVLMAEEEGEILLLCLNGEPRTFEEASEIK